MGRRQSEPPRDLLEKVMAVADAKAVLPAETRPYLNKWGVYCHVNHLPGGGRLYQAGGKFVTKLRFIVETNGSVVVRKHKPGDWESALEATHNHAKLWRSQAEAEQELAGLLADESIENRVALLERRVSERPDWVWPFLGDVYSAEGRFKDAERVYIGGLEMWPNTFSPHYYLGMFYLNALANTGMLKLPAYLVSRIWAKMPLNDIGYTFEQVCHLAEKHVAEALRLAPPKKSAERRLLEETLSELRHPGRLSFLGTGELELVQARQMLENNPDEAVSRLEQIVSRNPDSAPGWDTLAIGYMQTGRARDAERALLKAISLATNNPSPHLGLSTLYKAAMGTSRGATPPPGYGDITLEALGCSYEYARKMAEEHANEVLKLTGDKRLRMAARKSLEEIRMLDNS